VVTKGVIQHQRLNASTNNADLIWQGHVHEDYELTTIQEYYSPFQKKTMYKEVLNVRTSPYKEEFNKNIEAFKKNIFTMWILINKK